MYAHLKDIKICEAFLQCINLTKSKRFVPECNVKSDTSVFTLDNTIISVWSINCCPSCLKYFYCDG